jgi:hypothetical protein
MEGRHFLCFLCSLLFKVSFRGPAGKRRRGLRQYRALGE